MGQKRRNTPQQNYEPMYGWSLQSNGRPVPIALATRGAQHYFCPICHSPMIAKKGTINQHHFAHENINSDCTPEKVAQAIAGKWLVLTLGTMMVLHQPAFMDWTTHDTLFNANLLEGVTHIIENMTTPYGKAEIALIKEDDSIRAVMALHLLDRKTILKFTQHQIAVVLLPTERFRRGNVTLETVLDDVLIEGDWLLAERPTDLPNLKMDPDSIRIALASSVQYPPFRFWGPLVTIGERQNVLRINNELVWLPEAMWASAIGGGHNKLAEDLDIIIQEWKQSDNSTIALYYVKIKNRNERAVAVRRFMPGEIVRAQLNAVYQPKRTTAEDVAHSLAMGK